VRIALIAIPDPVLLTELVDAAARSDRRWH
jgi:hypothetical protein